MSSIWERIKEHKVAQWSLAYAAAAYTVLHGTEMVSNALEWPHVFVRLVTLLLILGLPLVITIAWYHGHRAQRRVSGTELTIITVLLAVIGTALWRFVPRHEGQAEPKAGTTAQTASAVVPRASTPHNERTIAVLPFLDLSEKRDQEYFADGMAEEILNLLVKIPELKVIGRTSSFQFKGKTDDLRKIGTTLGTTYVVEGSVRRSGDHARVTAQLVDTRDGSHRWSETYDRDIGDVLKVQGEIAAALVRALQLEVAPSILSRMQSSPRSSEAYELYLRGLHGVNRFDQRGFEEAVADFRHALELDPSFASAAEMLADIFAAQASWGYVPMQQGWEQARKAAQAALKLDSQSARAHATLGDVHLEYDWDWSAAHLELKTAVDLAPHDPNVLVTAATERLAVGHYGEALRLLDAAATADPLSAHVHNIAAWVYLRTGRYADAVRVSRRVVEISPTFAWGYADLALSLILDGKPAEALAEIQNEPDPVAQLVGLAEVYTVLHRRKDADAALERLAADHAADSGLFLAVIYALRGQKDQAFAWLDKAYAQKDANLWHVKGQPLLDSLETDLRYKAFLRKMNLPE
jgi:TolB-like protein/Flp pilus assembly protein TadD